MAHEYELRIERTLTVECEQPLTEAELIDLAHDALHDTTALWNVHIGNDVYPLRHPVRLDNYWDPGGPA